jgi:hypothetical protein
MVFTVIAVEGEYGGKSGNDSGVGKGCGNGAWNVAAALADPIVKCDNEKGGPKTL